MPKPPVFAVTRRTALTAGLAALAWRPTFAANDPEAATGWSLHVLDRLAFGPAPGDLVRIARVGAEAWIDEQLHPERLSLPSPVQQQLAALATPTSSVRDLVTRYREAEARAKEFDARHPPMAAASSAAMAPVEEAPNPERARRRELLQQVHFEAGEARLLRALASPAQLQEVMVEFWFNHFNVFDGKGLVRVLVESYEREAIRPNVFGRFRTLLGATARHPAMLFYLDNWLSVAPGWHPRRAQGKLAANGLNENYARELMELHTLGVDGGYTQRDVTELARMFTGWTIAPPRRRFGFGAQDDSLFAFDPARHDDGAKSWLGHTVAPGGIDEGEFALDVLARHPSTARHIAFKLAQYFVADEPPPALVDRLSHRFLDSDGDIRAVLSSLFASPEFRDPRHRGDKFKTPYRYVLSAVRASGVQPVNVRPLMATMNQLGQPLFGCPTPDGYKDTEAAWLNPNAIAQRVNFATALAAGRLPLLRAPRELADSAGADEPMARAAAMPPQATDGLGRPAPLALGPLLDTLGPSIGDKTRAAVAQADAGLRAALVLGSPDFMRH